MSAALSLLMSVFGPKRA